MTYIIRTPRLRRAVLLPNEYKPTMASARIAQWVADELGVELWDSAEKIRYEEIDELYFVYGLVAFSKFRDEMGALAPFVKKYVYIENDFGCHLTQLRRPLGERGIVPIMLSTIPNRVLRARGYYVDWNQLTWDPVLEESIAPQVSREENTLAYYGSFRKDRLEYFDKYFNTDLYDVHTFSGRTGQRQFASINQYGTLTAHDQALDLADTLNRYSCTIYIEDKQSHRNFSSVANRFYECLAAGIPILFDKSTYTSMMDGGFDVADYIVDGPLDINRAMPHLDRIGKEQRERWAGVDYKERLKCTFHNLLHNIAACDPCSNDLP